MNRNITNIIRFVMDECIPPIIRDNKYFMYPFFYMAYRGRNIERMMNFKSLVHDLSPEEYKALYADLNSVSRNRITDLNSRSLRLILDQVDSSVEKLADIGCGSGYLLNQVKKKCPQAILFGVDIVEKPHGDEYTFRHSDFRRLPFPDKSIDVVTCCHTLEHILDIEKAVAELKRITKRLLMVVVPCQRPYYYTLDEHVNFFPYKKKLTSVMNIENNVCEKVWGDWFYLGRLDESNQ